MARVSTPAALGSPSPVRTDDARFGDARSTRANEVQEQPVDKQPVDLNIATERLNKAARALSSELRFKIHQATHQIVVKVVDGDGRVIREIPPERVLDAYAKMMESLGLLVDEKI